MKINIAIDGPSGAGKSSIADILAKKLNYIHLDTGAMYRCVAYKANLNNIALDDEPQLVKMIEQTSIVITNDNDVFVDGIQVNKEIRTNEMSMAASNVSKLPMVRHLLVLMQQEMAKEKGYILDGRDIGTVVLKDAEVKIFLTASSKVRASRRQLQNLELGIETDLISLQEEIEKRDYQDTSRTTSPLKKADDAIEIDASSLTIDEVINTILDIIKTKNKEADYE